MSDYLRELLDLPNDWQFLGIPAENWILALAAFAVTATLVVVVRALILAHLGRRAEQTRTQVDDFVLELLRRTRFFFGVILGLVVATPFLALPASALVWERRLLVLLVLFQLGLWGNTLLNFWLARYTRRRMTVDAASVTTIRALVLLVKGLLWVVLFLIALQNFGVNVTALMTGLGIGGVAVALAVQSVLGDVLASLSIVLDKPFVEGDFIVVDQISGTVEQVGLRSTRIRSLSGEQLIVSNADLLRARIRNYKRMAERRIAFTVGLEYGASPEQLERAPQIIREVIAELPNTRVDRSHFWSFGESSLLIETVYFVLSPDYGMYMDTQQHINLTIMRRFRELGVSFAFPTRTLVVRGEGSDGSIRALVRSTGDDGVHGTLAPARD